METASAPGKVKNKKKWQDQEENRCRTVISQNLTSLVKTLGGGKKIDYKLQFFDPERFEDEEVEQKVESGDYPYSIIAAILSAAK